MNKEEIRELAENLKSRIFADRKTVDEAYNYFHSVMMSCHKDDRIYILTATHVLMNTVSNTLLELLDKE